MPTDINEVPKKEPNGGQALFGFIVLVALIVGTFASIGFGWHAGVALATHLFG